MTIQKLKAEMAEAGHPLSEGEHLVESDLQKIKDYHYFTGKDPVTAAYHIFFDSVSEAAPVADAPVEEVAPVVEPAPVEEVAPISYPAVEEEVVAEEPVAEPVAEEAPVEDDSDMVA